MIYYYRILDCEIFHYYPSYLPWIILAMLQQASVMLGRSTLAESHSAFH